MRHTRRRPASALLAATAALLALAAFGAQGAMAERGDDFGFAPVNTGDPGFNAPAYPGEYALWAGTCDLGSASTVNGGVGAHNGGQDPPAARGHCMDPGPAVAGEPFGIVCCAAAFGPEPPQWRLDPVTQAGAHPDATANFYFNQLDPPAFPTEGKVDGNVKNVIAKLPRGVVGNPEVVPKCDALQAQAMPPGCGPESQVGILALSWVPIDPRYGDNFPVYAIEARDTVTAEFTIGNVAQRFNIPVTARGRTNGDYGVDTLALLIPSYAELVGQSITLWGVPWAEEHDPYRVDSTAYFAEAAEIPIEGLTPAEGARGYDPSWGPIRPFFTNPTDCTGEELTTTVEMDSWQHPISQGGSYVVGETLAPPVTGCEKLEFDPAMTLRPDVRVADSPSGLDVELSIPQNNDPPAEAFGNPNLPFDPDEASGAPAYWRTDAGLATAHLKDTTVRLPVGTSFNPAAANGLRGCTTAQVGLASISPKITFNNDPHRCPDTAKIGTLEIVSPLLPDPLLGDVYAAPQHDNPFPGSLTAIYMVAQDEERGLSVKLPGKVDLDPATGQIATTFLDNPQLPFDSFRLKFKTGPRAPLNTPATCGQFKNDVDLTPWSFPHSGPIADIQDPFDITAMPNGFGCVTEPEDRSFAPGFEAGSTSTQAGAHTSFVLNVTRRDGEQEVSGITLEMPPGLTARLAGTPYCPDASLVAIQASRGGLAESTASLCPPASQVGVVDTLAGAGSLPLPTAGKLYLAGPYDPDGAGPLGTAPVSIAAVVPAIAGGVPGEPAFDLGNVVVRSAAYVDPKTAQVRVSSSRLPYILGGVPLRVRRISVDLDKPGFMLNPTNCSPFAVGGSVGGAADPHLPGDDIAAPVSTPFQVGRCAALGFKPRLSLRLFGKTKRAAYQRLRATLRPRPGDANIGSASVRMPPSVFLAQEHIKTVCTRVRFAADSCPRGSVYGRASAVTPLLDEPLSGPVYLRSSTNPLPDLVADLRGPAHQPIRVELVGRTDAVDGALRNTFDVAPDAPVSKFTLELFGGDRSLIVLSHNICTGPRKATVKLAGQNGRARNFRSVVRNPKCKGSKRKGHKR